MKKRRLTKKTGNIEFFIHKDEYIIYKISDQKPVKKKIVFLTGSKKIKHHTNKSDPADKHVRLIVSGRGGVRGSQFSKKFDDTKKSLEQVWKWEAQALESDNIEWRSPTLYFFQEFTGSIGLLRTGKQRSKKIKVELNLKHSNIAVLHGYPY